MKTGKNEDNFKVHKRSDLEHLRLFASYGQMMIDQNAGKKKSTQHPELQCLGTC